MGDLNIYSGPTGELVYDSEHGTDVAGYDTRIDQAYGDGVLLYYNPKVRTVHGYFNATRNAPEQFIGEYTSSSQDGDLLREFKSQVESELDQVGWPLLTDAGGKQEFYNDLRNVSAVEPSQPIGEIEEIINHTDTANDLKFGVPDRHTAARLIEYIQNVNNTVDVVVTEAYIPEEYENTSVKIYIGESKSGVVPIKDTKDAIKQNALREAVSAAQSSVKRLISTAGSDSAGADSEKVVRSLKEAKINSIGLKPKSSVVENDNSSILPWVITAAVLGIVLAFITIAYLSRSSLETKLTMDYTVGLSFMKITVGTYPTWQVLIMPTVTVVGFGSWLFLPWLVSHLRSSNKDPLNRDLSNGARDIVADLQVVKNDPLVESDEDFKKRANEAFEPLDHIHIVSADSEYREIINKIAGVAGGLVFAGSLGSLLWFSRAMIFESWETTVDIVLILALMILVIAGVYGLLWLGKRLLNPQARTTQGNKHRGKAARNPQHRSRWFAILSLLIMFVIIGAIWFIVIGMS